MPFSNWCSILPNITKYLEILQISNTSAYSVNIFSLLSSSAHNLISISSPILAMPPPDPLSKDAPGIMPLLSGETLVCTDIIFYAINTALWQIIVSNI